MVAYACEHSKNFRQANNYSRQNGNEPGIVVLIDLKWHFTLIMYSKRNLLPISEFKKVL